MAQDVQRFVYLPGGGGGGEDDLAVFAAGFDFSIHFDTISYPGWQRYVQDEFCPNVFLDELIAEISVRVPEGPIQIMGLSLGGHLGYAAGLRLQQMGRKVALFCAIDAFMIASAQPSAGWRKRALSDALDLLRKGRLRDLATLVRSKVWRAFFRLASERVSRALRQFPHGRLAALLRADTLAEQEFSMRLLLRALAPWIATLDQDTVSLRAPTILLRTHASAASDAAWKLRCPNLAIREVPGKHLTLFEPENIGGLREAFRSAMTETSKCSTSIP